MKKKILARCHAHRSNGRFITFYLFKKFLLSRYRQSVPIAYESAADKFSHEYIISCLMEIVVNLQLGGNDIQYQLY